MNVVAANRAEWEKFDRMLRRRYRLVDAIEKARVAVNGVIRGDAAGMSPDVWAVELQQVVEGQLASKALEAYRLVERAAEEAAAAGVEVLRAPRWQVAIWNAPAK